MTRQSEYVCITGLGMASALAPNVRDSCAAFRAGITRISKLDTMPAEFDETLGEDPVSAYRAAYLADGYSSGAKVVLLGKLALGDLLQRVTRVDDDRRTGMVVYLSDCFLLDTASEPAEDEEDALPSARWRVECKSLVARMLSGVGLKIASEDQHLLFGEHAGFVTAVQTAADLVASAQLDRCFVGAVDSCLDAEFLLAASVGGLLKTSLNPVGFVPGEAAAFVLLERSADTRRGKTLPLASFVCGEIVPGQFDRFSEEPADGAVLAKAIGTHLAMQEVRPELALVIGDFNGDEYRARNWGSTLIRLGDRRIAALAPMWIPALGFGETGAASGAISLCLAVRAMERGEIRDGAAMVWLSDEKGSAAAMTIMPVEI